LSRTKSKSRSWSSFSSASELAISILNSPRTKAGGLTTACTLHGSANPIGGTYAVIELRWGALPDELLVPGAKPGIKLALGENVKLSSGRYPNTRMGVVEIIRGAFLAAKDYRRQWQTYNEQSKKNRSLIPPRTNLRCEHLLDVLDGKMIIHCHSYRQNEIHAMLCLSEEIGFKFDVFIHVLEAAKAAAYGFPKDEALKAITLYPAQIMGVADRVGSLKKGKDATLPVTDGDPLEITTHI